MLFRACALGHGYRLGLSSPRVAQRSTPKSNSPDIVSGKNCQPEKAPSLCMYGVTHVCTAL